MEHDTGDYAISFIPFNDTYNRLYPFNDRDFIDSFRDILLQVQNSQTLIVIEISGLNRENSTFFDLIFRHCPN